MPPVQVDRVELRAGGAERGGGLGGELAHEDGAAPRLGGHACGRAVVDRIEGTLLEAACHWPPLWYLRFAWVRLRPPCRQPLP